MVVTPDQHLNLPRLRQFLVLAGVGHFGRAAKLLKIGQPALSLNMQKLEAELNCHLLERHSRGVTLTPSGEALAKAANLMSGFIGPACKAKVKDQASIIVGVPSTLSSLLSANLFEYIQAKVPHVKVSFYEAGTRALEIATATGRVDVALLYEAPKLREVVSIPIVDEKLFFVFPPMWRLQTPGRHYKLRDLSAYPLILGNIGGNERNLVAKLGEQYRVDLNIILEVDSPRILQALIRKGCGATITGGATFHEEVARGSLTRHPVDKLQTRLSISISCHKMSETEAAPFVEAVRSVIAEAVEGGEWPGAKLIHV